MGMITLISIKIYKQIVLRKPNGSGGWVLFNKPWIALCTIKINNVIHMHNIEGNTKEELESIAEERFNQWIKTKNLHP